MQTNFTTRLHNFLTRGRKNYYDDDLDYLARRKKYYQAKIRGIEKEYTRVLLEKMAVEYTRK